MAFEPFWDETISEEIISATDGCLVQYRGAEFHMHYEQPTVELQQVFADRVVGFAKVLIGDRDCWPDRIELGTLVTVDGDDWVLGGWETTTDGQEIYIALTRSTRV